MKPSPCICPTRPGIRVEHPRCPVEGHGQGEEWRVVVLPRKGKPGG